MKYKTTDERLLDIYSDLDNISDFPVKNICKKIAIISTPRCGSSMFCNVLYRTNKFGNPKEWLNMRYLATYAKYFKIKNISLDQYLAFIYRKTTSSNGVFAINFHISQYREMLKLNFNVLNLNFNKVYYLSRKDKIEQAYSYAKATITDQWSSVTQPTNKIKGEIRREEILRALFHIISAESYYNDNLKSHVNKEYVYEDYSDLKNTNIFSEVMLDCDITNFEPTWNTSMKKQRNQLTLNEVAVFKEYLCPE